MPLALISSIAVGGCGEEGKSQNVELNKKRELLNIETFGDELSRLEKKYKTKSSTQNQAAMTLVRKERKEIISSFPNEFENWEVKLKNVVTDTDGEASVEFVIPEHPQILMRATVEPNHESYNNIANARLGSIMIISGAFREGDDEDYFIEYSFTERGSMTEPEFAIELLNANLSYS